MVITRENPVVIRQKNMIMKSKHTDTKRYQNTKKELDKKQGLADIQNNQDLLTKGQQ